MFLVVITSYSIHYTKLYEAALVAFQGACPNVPKGETAKIRGTSKGGKDYEMEYSYADIAACIRHCSYNFV